MEKKITKENVELRIHEWIVQLNSLFDKIEEWIQAFPDYRVKREQTTQRIEELMQRYGVKPREVPILKILSERQTISFVPSAIWIIGADGRVNITTNRKQYGLVYTRKPRSRIRNWFLVSPDPSRALMPFDERTFLKLLREKR